MTLPPLGSSSSRSQPVPDPSSLSLFELPVSRGARWARIFVVLVLDIALAGTGIAMIIAYVNARSDAADQTETVAIDAGVEAQLEVLDPEPVPNEPEDTAAEPVGDSRVARRDGRSQPTGSKRSKRPKQRARDTSPATDPRSEPAPARRPDAAPTPAPGATPAEPGPDAGADEPDDAEVSTLSAKIRTVVLRHRPQIKRCYAQAAKVTSPTDPLEGRIDIRFSVNPDGSASGVRVVRNATDSDALGTCLTGLISSWGFPAGHASPVSFIWPFRFTAPKNQ